MKLPRPVPLEPPGMALAHGDDGTMVGLSTTDAGTGNVWTSDGAGRALPVPDGVGVFTPMNIAGDWAAGSAIAVEIIKGGSAVLRWNLRTGDVDILADPVSGAAPALHINASGDVAFTRGGDGPGPVLVRGGVTHVLPSLPGLDDGRMQAQTRVQGVSDDGTTVAGTLHTLAHPVLWRC